jgi:hypothetical protein
MSSPDPSPPTVPAPEDTGAAAADRPPDDPTPNQQPGGAGSEEQVADNGKAPDQARDFDPRQFFSVFESMKDFIDMLPMLASFAGSGQQNNGSWVINNNFNGQASRSTPPAEPGHPGTPLPSDFEELREVYIDHGCYKQARTILYQRFALVIFGEPGSGRETLARRLVADLRGSGNEQAPARLLPNTHAILDYSDDDFKNVVSGQIYVLVLEQVVAGAALTQEMFELLIKRVTEKSSYLIVIGHMSLAALREHSLRVHITTRDIPSKIEVFQRHLKYKLTGGVKSDEPAQSMALMDELLKNDTLLSILSDAPDSLYRIVDLAQAVAGLLEQGDDIAKILQFCKQCHSSWLDECAAEWLTQAQHSRAHLCLLIAGAVLSGIDAADFLPLAQELRKSQLFGSTFTAEDEETWRQLSRSASTYWMTFAHVRPSQQMAWQGSYYTRTEILTTRPEEISLYLIRAFWSLYMQDQAHLCAWLKSLGMREELSWRARVAVARTVGMLKLISPPRIESEIIRPWLESGLIMPQQSAAMSLAFASSRDRNVALSVLQQMKSWERDENTRRRLIYASALIYAWLGVDQPDMFINGMRRLVRGRNALVLLVRSKTIVEIDPQTQVELTEVDVVDKRTQGVVIAFRSALLLGHFDHTNYEQLFDMLCEWSISEFDAPRRIARAVFVDMMQLHKFLENARAPGDSATEPGAAHVPLLLYILWNHPEVMPRVGQLFIYAASTRRATRDSLQGLKRMIFAAGQVRAARPALKEFVRIILVRKPTSDVTYMLRQTLYEWAINVKEAREQGIPDEDMEDPPYSQQLVKWLYKNNLL